MSGALFVCPMVRDWGLRLIETPWPNSRRYKQAVGGDGADRLANSLLSAVEVLDIISNGQTGVSTSGGMNRSAA